MVLSETLEVNIFFAKKYSLRSYMEVPFALFTFLKKSCQCN